MERLAERKILAPRVISANNFVQYCVIRPRVQLDIGNYAIVARAGACLVLGKILAPKVILANLKDVPVRGRPFLVCLRYIRAC